MYILGQILGLIGTAVTIATPQFRTKFQILFCNASVNALNALSFAMLGQTGSAVYLCLIAIVQTLVSMWHEKKQTAVMTWETILFFILYAGFGFYGMISSSGSRKLVVHNDGVGVEQNLVALTTGLYHSSVSHCIHLSFLLDYIPETKSYSASSVSSASMTAEDLTTVKMSFFCASFWASASKNAL